MSRIRLVGVAVAVVALVPTWAPALDISAKKIFLKGHADPAKRQIKVQSVDPAVLLGDVDDPATNGMTIRVYSATDDVCVTLPGGLGWTNKPTKKQYKDKATKNAAQVSDGKLIVKIKTQPLPGFTLDEPTQGAVNAQVQFGTGLKYCLRCATGNKKDEPNKYFGKDCVAAACDPEPAGICDPTATTTTSSTTTTTTTSTTTTTCPPTPPVTPTKVVGSLTATPGRFNYAGLGVPGANAACNTNFPGTHACTYQELQIGEAACDLPGLTDTSAATVTSFWAIDSGAPILQQCNDDRSVIGSNINWEYPTADTPSRGQRVSLNNTTGVLGPLTMNVQCNIAGNSWVACCL
ncbi:MAG TPA: hypothetical protein VKA21_08325 [Candidatus Binatia bacterium]|nr:hypothetical protein [Candidatus Binatia bacterium]